MLTAIRFRFGVEITDEEFELLLDRIPLDEDENVRYLQFMPCVILGTPFSHFLILQYFSVLVVFNTENGPLEELGLLNISLH